jgi:hypothetical protein
MAFYRAKTKLNDISRCLVRTIEVNENLRLLTSVCAPHNVFSVCATASTMAFARISSELECFLEVHPILSKESNVPVGGATLKLLEYGADVSCLSLLSRIFLACADIHSFAYIGLEYDLPCRCLDTLLER